jgi:hypothetical protein
MNIADFANLIVATASLIVALVALVIAKRLAQGSASAPMIIQQLYELVSYFDSYTPEQIDVIKRSEEVKADWQELRKRQFILRHVGFQQEIDNIEILIGLYNDQKRKIKAAGNTPSEEEAREFLNRIAAVDLSVQNLLSAIEPKLALVIDDPFTHIPKQEMTDGCVAKASESEIKFS